MKIIKEKEANPLTAVTFRLPKDLLEKVTELAEKNDVSRQKLVTAILEHAIGDKKFELKIKG
jgi:predicted transcriptional regulator